MDLQGCYRGYTPQTPMHLLVSVISLVDILGSVISLVDILCSVISLVDILGSIISLVNFQLGRTYWCGEVLTSGQLENSQRCR